MSERVSGGCWVLVERKKVRGAVGERQLEGSGEQMQRLCARGTGLLYPVEGETKLPTTLYSRYPRFPC